MAKRQFEPIGDVLGRQPHMAVELVDNERQLIGLDAARTQLLEHGCGGHDRADALIAHDPGALGFLYRLRHEVDGREAAEVGNLIVEELAQPLDQGDRVGVRDLAHLG
ncbi:hypothetical protein D3C72_1947920 [compost metagenome]